MGGRCRKAAPPKTHPGRPPGAAEEIGKTVNGEIHPTTVNPQKAPQGANRKRGNVTHDGAGVAAGFANRFIGTSTDSQNISHDGGALGLLPYLPSIHRGICRFAGFSPAIPVEWAAKKLPGILFGDFQIRAFFPEELLEFRKGALGKAIGVDHYAASDRKSVV